MPVELRETLAARAQARVPTRPLQLAAPTLVRSTSISMTTARSRLERARSGSPTYCRITPSTEATITRARDLERDCAELAGIAGGFLAPLCDDSYIAVVLPACEVLETRRAERVHDQLVLHHLEPAVALDQPRPERLGTDPDRVLEPLVGLGRLVQDLRDLAAHVLDDALEQLFLGAENVGESPQGHPRFGGDAAHRGPLDPVTRQHATRSRDELCAPHRCLDVGHVKSPHSVRCPRLSHAPENQTRYVPCFRLERPRYMTRRIASLPLGGVRSANSHQTGGEDRAV